MANNDIDQELSPTIHNTFIGRGLYESDPQFFRFKVTLNKPSIVRTGTELVDYRPYSGDRWGTTQAMFEVVIVRRSSLSD